MRVLAAAFTTVSALAMAPAANAASFLVDARDNSSSGGLGLATGLLFSVGDTFTVNVGVDDLWSAGALPRWSDANGLTGNRFATGSDESGELVGTLIGIDFGTWTQNGLSAPYGSLVGEINGVYNLLGTSFSGPAWETGTLNLYYWDSNNFDNAGAVTANIQATAVPEPATWAMLLVGFGMIGFGMRRKAVAPRVRFNFA